MLDAEVRPYWHAPKTRLEAAALVIGEVGGHAGGAVIPIGVDR